MVHMSTCVKEKGKGQVEFVVGCIMVASTLGSCLVFLYWIATMACCGAAHHDIESRYGVAAAEAKGFVWGVADKGAEARGFVSGGRGASYGGRCKLGMTGKRVSWTEVNGCFGEERDTGSGWESASATGRVRAFFFPSSSGESG